MLHVPPKRDDARRPAGPEFSDPSPHPTIVSDGTLNARKKTLLSQNRKKGNYMTERTQVSWRGNVRGTDASHPDIARLK